MAELDAADRNHLPDRDYAFPKARKEPLEDAQHVRNAVARFDQVQGVSDAERDEAWTRIKAAARKFDVELSETSWRDLGKPGADRRSPERSPSSWSTRPTAAAPSSSRSTPATRPSPD